MQIVVHPMLEKQRAVLDLPTGERHAALMYMLEPFEPMLKIMVRPGSDPISLFRLMRPDGPTAAYAAALTRLEEVGAEETCGTALDRAARAMLAVGYGASLGTIQFGLFLLDQNPQLAMMDQDYTGFGGIPGYIMVSLWPDDRNLPKLGACVAHEFNHQIRLSVEPWRMDISLGEYLVMEGLAESFAAEIFGSQSVGPWVAEVQPEALETARQALGPALGIRGFNEVRPYIFGDEVMAMTGGQPIGVPAYAGYAAGFHIVQSFLRQTGATAAEATLVPSSDILRATDFF